MGSFANQNPWAPYDNFKDCSQGICSIYCPQFCYFIFPPPPPSDQDSTTPFSPLIIAIIGVLASAFLLVSYYTIVTRYCKRRNQNTSQENDEHHDEITNHEQFQAASTGLDEALIKTIAVCKYRKEDGLIEGTECAVCLSEFQENESLRLLPKCSHAFHLPCIDTWLKSHSNCPLCRSNVIALAHPLPPPLPSSQALPALSVESYQAPRQGDVVLVVDDNQQRNCVQQVVVNLIGEDDATPKSPIRDGGNEETRNGDLGSDQEGVKQFRRSISLGTFRSHRQLLISDILKIQEMEEKVQMGTDQSWRGVGPSKGYAVGEMKRTVSTGRCVFTVHDEKGKNSLA